MPFTVLGKAAEKQMSLLFPWSLNYSVLRKSNEGEEEEMQSRGVDSRSKGSVGGKHVLDHFKICR